MRSARAAWLADRRLLTYLRAACAGSLLAALAAEISDLVGTWQAIPAGLACLLAVLLAVTDRPAVRNVASTVAALALLLTLGGLLDGDSIRLVHLLYLPALALLYWTAWRTWPQVRDYTGLATVRHRIAGQEQARTQIARELHDDTLQALGKLRRDLDSATTNTSAETIAQASNELTVQIANLRRIVTFLHPAALTHVGLPAAIDDLLERTSISNVGPTLTLAVEDPAGLGFTADNDIILTCYRVVQESLTNALRHSGATAIDITVIRQHNTVGARIHDNGAGFDSTTLQHGYGLYGMTSRAAAHGGRLHITSSTGTGTCIAVTLPARRTR